MEGTGCEDGSCERGGLEGGELRVEGGERGAMGGVLGAGDKACANTVGGNGRGEGVFSGNSDGVLLRLCGGDLGGGVGGIVDCITDGSAVWA